MTDWENMYSPQPVRLGDLLPDAADNVGIACMFRFQKWLDIIDIDSPQAFIYFMIDYHNCYTVYNRDWIVDVCERVAAANAKKYDMMTDIYAAEFNPLENYDRQETSTHTRTPNITKSTTTSANSGRTTTVDETQSKTTTTTPADIQVERQISPFDTNTYKAESKTITGLADGSTAETVVESWDGEPSTTTTTENGSGSGSETETGTETTQITSRIHGNIGVMSSQNMAEQSLQLAAKMNIWNTIKRDIAAAVCVGVWT